MRSAIACDKCRRSKIKCDNDGINSQCKQCKQGDRACSYNAPTSGGARRASSTTTPNGAGKRPGAQGETPQKRQRKGTGPTSHPIAPQPDGLGESNKALDPSLLTPKVWIELLEIFQRHYATDLPFLHATTFRKPLKQATGSSNVRPPYSDLLLLSFLALTSRFHDGLVQHHTTQSLTPALDTAEYYADEARKLLVSPTDAHTSLERIQAQLMLGFHEWGMCQGVKAWLSIGSAISLAQAQGLQYDCDFDNMKEARMHALSPDINYKDVLEGRAGYEKGTSQDVNPAQQEIRRRTFWSCFIMDRYISSGKHRPLRLNIDDIRVPLPISEEAFTFGRKETTPLLKPKQEKEVDTLASRSGHDTRFNHHQENGHKGLDWNNGNGRDFDDHSLSDTAESGYREGFLSCFIRSISLWNEHMIWSCAGGRRTEKQNPPWSDKTTFKKLDQKLQAFTQRLPEAHKFTLENVAPHAEHKSSSAYTLIHSALLLCGVMLHREYIPFTPHTCKGPEGPLDEPTLPAEVYPLPNPHWWEDSAAECFRCGRDCLDLLWACKEEGVLVETPLTAFSAFEVAVVALYQFHFPKMDTHGYMRSTSADKAEHIKKAYAIVCEMIPRLKMARLCRKVIKALNEFFHQKKAEYAQHERQMNSCASPESADSSNSSYTRGGGLPDYERLEAFLKEFGAVVDYDDDFLGSTDPADNYQWERTSRASEACDEAIKVEPLSVAPKSETPIEDASPQNHFKPINPPPPVRLDSARVSALGNAPQPQISQHNTTPYSQPHPRATHDGYGTQQPIQVGGYHYNQYMPAGRTQQDLGEQHTLRPDQNNHWSDIQTMASSVSFGTPELGPIFYGTPVMPVQNRMPGQYVPEDWLRQAMYHQ